MTHAVRPRPSHVAVAMFTPTPRTAWPLAALGTQPWKSSAAADTGPLGATALVLVVLLQISALATLPGRLAVIGLVLGTVTARTAVVRATGPGFPAARATGFGALVAGRASARVGAVAVIALLAAVSALGELTEGSSLTARLPAATVSGLLAATAVCRAARSRLGGLTGDVFGAVVEITMTVTLIALAVLT